MKKFIKSELFLEIVVIVPIMSFLIFCLIIPFLPKDVAEFLYKPLF